MCDNSEKKVIERVARNLKRIVLSGLIIVVMMCLFTTSTSARTCYNCEGDSSVATNYSGNELHAAQENVYRITYDANGGVGAPSSQIKHQGESLQLSNTIPTRDYDIWREYKFQGWATNPCGDVTYASGADYNIDADITLYAVWDIVCETCKGAGEIDRDVRCSVCGGAGYKIGKETCTTCSGSGQRLQVSTVQCALCKGAGGIVNIYGDFWLCSSCDGKGSITVREYVTCYICDGNGTIQVENDCHECDEGTNIVRMVCSNCDGFGVEKTQRHNYGEGKIITESTCNTNGVKSYICTKCGDVKKESIPLVDHIWNAEFTVDKEASCTGAGMKSIYCGQCGLLKPGSTVEIDMLNHSYGEWITVTESTAYECGLEKRICSGCKNEETRPIPKMEITTGDTKSILFVEANESTCFAFTPTQSGIYKLSIDREPVYLCLYDSQNNIISQSDSDVLFYHYNADEVYYLQIRGEQAGEYKASMEKINGIFELSIESYPTRNVYYKDVLDYSFKGLKIKAVMEDGDVVYWKYGDNDLIGYDVEITQSAMSENRVYFVVRCGELSTDFSFELIDNPVVSIEVASGEMPKMIEYEDGYYSGTQFVYNTDAIKDMIFKINYFDGSSEMCNVGNEINGYVVSFNHNQLSIPWGIGTENYIVVSYAGKSVSVPVTVVKPSVERIVLNSAPTNKLVWGDCQYGYLDYYNQGEYNLWNLDMTGLSITVFYENGTQQVFTDDDINAGKINGNRYHLYYDNSNIQIGMLPVVFEYMNCKVEYEVEVVEPNVSSIEVIQDPNVVLYDDRYKPDFLGMKIKVTYDNNQSEVIEVAEDNTSYNLHAEDICEVSVAESVLMIRDGYVDEHGKSYYWLNYMGAEYKYYGISFCKGKEIAYGTVSDFSDNSNNMIIRVVYVDGTSEDISVKWNETLEMSGSGIYIDAMTSKGLLFIIIERNEAEEYVISSKLGEFVYASNSDIDTLQLERNPNKVVYDIGEPLDTNGLVIKAIYRDGTYEYLEEGYELNGFDSTKEGICVVVVKYKGREVTFNITVRAQNTGRWMLDSIGYWYQNANGTYPAGCWKQIDGIWYYFNSSGYMVIGWLNQGDVWYYLGGSGAMVTGWQSIGGTWYYFNGSGAMMTGWQLIGGTWYYFSGSGAMVTGWQSIGSTWYYFNGSGAMVTGWQAIGGVWYYFHGSGAMAANQWVGNYYLQADGSMATNRWIGIYYVGADGCWIP